MTLSKNENHLSLLITMNTNTRFHVKITTKNKPQRKKNQ